VEAALLSVVVGTAGTAAYTASGRPAEHGGLLYKEPLKMTEQSDVVRAIRHALEDALGDGNCKHGRASRNRQNDQRAHIKKCIVSR
jgi:hypothetical protein